MRMFLWKDNGGDGVHINNGSDGVVISFLKQMGICAGKWCASCV
nr:hypothetical protein [Shigella sonnei]